MSGGEAGLLGRWGETLAAGTLREKGHTLLAARWRCRFGEIDLITQCGPFLCFVEVKLRKTQRYGSPAEFVDRRKQDRLRAAALLYLEEHPTQLQPRFDVVEVLAPQGTDTKRPVVRHIENAF